MARRFLFIASCALLFAALLGNRESFAQGKENSSSFPFDRETEKVVSDQESAKKAASRRLSEQIENAQKRLESSKLPADQILAFRDTLKREQERFEKHVLIPFSAPLRSASVDYLREQLKADVSTNLRFAELIVKWEKKLSAPQLEELKRRHSAVLKPTIVARWTHQTGANRRSEIDSYPMVASDPRTPEITGSLARMAISNCDGQIPRRPEEFGSTTHN